MYNPNDWYWQKQGATDAFSSARSVMVGENDAGFKAHVAAYGGAQSWPRDAQGNETLAALQEVLTPYRLFAGLLAYAENARWKREQSGVSFGGMTVLTDDRSKTMLMGARIAAEADAGFTTPWDAGDTIITLTAEQVIAASNAVLAHVQQCFVIFAQVKAGIAGNTITTREQIDAAFEA